MHRLFLTMLIGVCHYLCVHCQSSSAAEAVVSDEDLKNTLAALCQKHNVPSLTIAAVRSGEVLAMECSGVRKRGTNDAVELSDRHPIGSCTKSMTATLAAVLVESGKIEWSTTLGDVWPQAPAKKLHPALREVTLNELLSHQSGLTTDLGGTKWISFFEEKASPPKERRRMLNLILHRKPKHPRGEYNYANLGFVVAAAMMEKQTGENFEAMMREKVFKPLKMETADFRTLKQAKKLKEPLLWGHRENGEAINPRVAGAENPSVYASCGTVNLSIADYAKYAQWHLGGKPEPVLADQDTFDQLHTGQVDASSVGGKYGCGWIVLETGLGPALNHGGSNTNSRALIWVFPNLDFAAVACTNTGEQAGFLASDEAIQELIKKYARKK